MRYFEPIEGADRRGQPEACVLFMGTGKRVTEAEREAYHKDVSVHLNKKTWVDNEFATKWIQILCENRFNLKTIFKDDPGARQASSGGMHTLNIARTLM